MISSVWAWFHRHHWFLTSGWKPCPGKHATSSRPPWDRQDRSSPTFLELSSQPPWHAHPTRSRLHRREEPVLAAPGALVFLWVPWQKFCHRDTERTQQTPGLHSYVLLEAEKETLVKEKLGEEEQYYNCIHSVIRAFILG